MKYRPIVVNDNQEELTQHGTEDFPMSMDDQPVCNVCRTPHWHHEIQIATVTKGEMVFNTPQGDFLVKKGEGIFINAGVLHEVTPTDDLNNSSYICVNFLPSMIYGALNSQIRKYYVDPLLFSSKLKTVVLKDEAWQKFICEKLVEMGKLESAKPYGYELSCKIALLQIWETIVINNREALEENYSVSFSDLQRIKMLKQYIHKNYMDKIGLTDIATAGFISRSECCRLFKRVENTTPILYLKHFRIIQSIKLLTDTDKAISDIANQTGFSSSSYYAESFKNEMGCTPLEYRHQHKSKKE